MTGSNVMGGWVALIGLLAMIALILTAFGIMLGIVKPADAGKHMGTILGVAIVLLLMPGMLARAWAGMLLWQRVAAVAVGVAIVERLRARRPRPKKRRNNHSA